MNNSFTKLSLALSVSLIASASPALVATFNVNDIVFTNVSLNGNPFVETNHGGAQFDWTYNAGDFVNGTGHLTALILPFGAYAAGGATYTSDLTGITGTGNGNFDHNTYDFIINFAPGLTSPSSSTTVSGGSYDFTGIDRYNLGGEFVGTITGGTVTPNVVPEPLSALALIVGFAALKHRKSKST